MSSNKTVKFLAISVLPAFLAITTLSPVAYGQLTSGDLVGLVNDPSGAGVPQAKVEVVETSTGIRTATTTETSGQYRFNNLHIGHYDLTVSASGFSSSTLKAVAVELNKTAT